MNIILDDSRKFPDEQRYNCVRTYEECVELIRLFRHISFISLDFDLGPGKSGLDVLVYMKENGYTAKHINIHSSHIEGRPQMMAYVERHFPDAILTQNAL